MLVKIVGIQSQDYKLDNGYSFTGNKVHCIDLESTNEGLLGHQVMDFKIPADHPLASVLLVVGDEYRLYFDRKGKVDMLMKNPK